jgi:hypothetical protein
MIWGVNKYVSGNLVVNSVLSREIRSLRKKKKEQSKMSLNEIVVNSFGLGQNPATRSTSGIFCDVCDHVSTAVCHYLLILCFSAECSY